MKNSIKINEIFCSLQGEGMLAGVCSVFIRLPGCPLKCKWCDTKYAWSPDNAMEYTYQQVKDFIMDQPAGHIVITGGEPMVCEGIKEFIDFLSSSGMHITIETSGIEFISGLKCNLMSISPKLSNSLPENEKLRIEHKNKCFHIDVLKKLINKYDYQLKFVVDRKADLDEIATVIDKLQPDIDKVLLMPQAVNSAEYISKAKKIADACVRSGFRLSPRLQVLLWPNKREK